VTLTQRGSAVLAALPEVRDLTAARDAVGLRQLLIPLKSRLALDLAFVSDPDGKIIAGAQDFKPGDTLPAELVVRVQAGAESSYVINTDPRGLMIKAITRSRAARSARPASSRPARCWTTRSSRRSGRPPIPRSRSS